MTRAYPYPDLNGLRNHPNVQAEIGMMKKQTKQIDKFVFLFEFLLSNTYFNQIFILSYSVSTN